MEANDFDKELEIYSAKMWRAWQAHDKAVFESLTQYCPEDKERLIAEMDKIAVLAPKTSERISLVKIREYSADITNKVTGLCAGWPGEARCNGCEKDVSMIIRTRVIREKGPYQPDKDAEFNFNLAGMRILSDTRCDFS